MHASQFILYKCVVASVIIKSRHDTKKQMIKMIFFKE